jgi:hypothetical protein
MHSHQEKLKSRAKDNAKDNVKDNAKAFDSEPEIIDIDDDNGGALQIILAITLTCYSHNFFAEETSIPKTKSTPKPSTSYSFSSSKPTTQSTKSTASPNPQAPPPAWSEKLDNIRAKHANVPAKDRASKVFKKIHQEFSGYGNVSSSQWSATDPLKKQWHCLCLVSRYSRAGLRKLSNELHIPALSSRPRITRE